MVRVLLHVPVLISSLFSSLLDGCHIVRCSLYPAIGNDNARAASQLGEIGDRIVEFAVQQESCVLWCSLNCSAVVLIVIDQEIV